MQVPRLIAICLPRFLVVIPRFLVVIPRFLVAIPRFLVAIPRFLVAIPRFLVATIPQIPISCCYPSLPTAGHFPPHIWSSTRTPSFSTLTLGQPPQETSRSTGTHTGTSLVTSSCVFWLVWFPSQSQLALRPPYDFYLSPPPSPTPPTLICLLS